MADLGPTPIAWSSVTKRRNLADFAGVTILLSKGLCARLGLGTGRFKRSPQDGNRGGIRIGPGIGCSQLLAQGGNRLNQRAERPLTVAGVIYRAAGVHRGCPGGGAAFPRSQPALRKT